MKYPFSKHYCRYLFLWMALSAGTLQSMAQPVSLSFRDTALKIDQLFTSWGTQTPGGVLLVSRGGRILYEKSFGLSDLEHNVINTTETVFEAGSVSKQFTAAAVLMLVQQGKISLQDDIRKYFPDFPDYGEPITVEDLLHHTSGLRDWGVVASFGGWPRGTRAYNPAHVREIIWRQKGINFKPGDEYSYSNSNYNMLTFLVEKVSGISHQLFTQEYIFKPLGMLHTKWRSNYREVIPNRAIAYSLGLNGFILNMPFENTFGHGALLTTAEDLEKWNQRWRTASLGEELNKLQSTTIKLNNGKPITYAAGVVMDRFNGTREISHSGATAGYRAWLAYYPEAMLSVVFLSNLASTDPTAVGRSVAGIFLGQPQPEKIERSYQPENLTTDELKKFTGLYVNHTGENVEELIIDGDSLRWKRNKSALIPFGNNRFYQPNGLTLVFSKPGEMKMISPRGDTSVYTGVRSFDPDSKELANFAGTYGSEEADVKVTVTLREGRLQVFLSPETTIFLRPVYTDTFFDPESVVYKFLRGRKNEIVGFTVTSGRVRNLLFVKMKQPV